MQATPAIAVQDLVKSFGSRRALDGVSFTVPPGVIFGLLGPNGGGKSTLFRVLSTLLAPLSGSASILGVDVARDPAAVRRGIGVVFQSPSLDKKLSVFENLWHQGHLYNMRGAPLRGRIDDLLRRFGLAERAGDRVETLSGGLARRVEIAKSLLHQPAVLLLDEPSTGLDPAARRDLWQQLEEVSRRDGVTILMTTHILEEAEGCAMLAILDQGKLIATGTPDELKASIAGGMVTVESADPEALCREIGERLGARGRVINAVVRLNVPDAYAFAGRLTETFGSRIRSVTVGRPTLEDVFLEKTGRAFGAGGAA